MTFTEEISIITGGFSGIDVCRTFSEAGGKIVITQMGVVSEAAVQPLLPECSAQPR